MFAAVHHLTVSWASWYQSMRSVTLLSEGRLYITYIRSRFGARRLILRKRKWRTKYGHDIVLVGRVAQSVYATRYGLDGPRIESRWGARFSALVHTGPGAHPASCTMGTGSFPGVKSGRGVTLTPHPLLVPWSWKSRAIPRLRLWAVRPVQSLSACTRVHFTT
jgi:hypothetical protein